MLDAKFIRDNEGLVRQSLENRNYDMSVLEKFLTIDRRWRALTDEGNSLRQKRNEVSELVPKLSKDEKQAMITEMKAIAGRIKEIEDDVRKIEDERDECLLNMPNIPDPSVPVGKSADDNPTTSSGARSRKFDFKPLTPLGARREAGHHRLRPGGEGHRDRVLLS